MEFEENKVVSAFNMHDVQLKDLGWFGNTRKELKMKVETEKPLQLIARDFTLAHIFQSEEGGRSIFFYPAPYEYLQAQWVKENNLKVGDKIKIVRSWERGEKGFIYCVEYFPIGEVVEVTGITSYRIKVIDTKGDKWGIPYYVIEKVKDEYRPFKDAEEFKPYRDEWFIFKESGYKVKFGAYGKDGVYHSNDMTNDDETTYEQLFERFTFEWGNPAGVKV